MITGTRLWRDKPISQRIEHVGWIETPSGCWEWRGRRNEHGYALFNHRRVHRLIYEMRVGPIAEGLVVRHYVCDNPPCVNPAHLLVGTRADNQRDMAEKGRAKRATCPAGHDRTLPGATKLVRRPGRPDESACVECSRTRSRRWVQIQRASLSTKQ